MPRISRRRGGGACRRLYSPGCGHERFDVVLRHNVEDHRARPSKDVAGRHRHQGQEEGRGKAAPLLPPQRCIVPEAMVRADRGILRETYLRPQHAPARGILPRPPEGRRYLQDVPRIGAHVRYIETPRRVPGLPGPPGKQALFLSVPLRPAEPPHPVPSGPHDAVFPFRRQ